MTVTSRLHRQKDKERQNRIQIDVRWGLEDPEAGGEAQTLGRLARDRGFPFPKTCEGIKDDDDDYMCWSDDDDDVYYYIRVRLNETPQLLP